MSERRTIGQILIGLGRISEDDVARALEHQRDNGGYFGEALVASGAVTQDELEWGLASQHDLPYVFPDADAIDLEVAALVSAEWALSNLTLPIMRMDDTVRVIVDSPLKDDPIRELRDRTGLEVELALAAPAAIREVIGEVFARLASAEEDGTAPAEMLEALDEILRSTALRFGISVRGTKAMAWWETASGVRRRPLAGGWKADIEARLSPSPSEMIRDTNRVEWEGALVRDDEVVPVAVRFMADECGRELAFERKRSEPDLTERFGAIPPDLAGEIVALAHAGDALVEVRSSSSELARSIMPHLPALLLGPFWRSIYVCTQGGAEHEVFSTRLSTDGSGWRAEADALRAFSFDVAAIDLAGATGDSGILAGVAGAVFVLGGADAPAALGLRWTLDIEPGTGDDLSWSLGPLNG